MANLRTAQQIIVKQRKKIFHYHFDCPALKMSLKVGNLIGLILAADRVAASHSAETYTVSRDDWQQILRACWKLKDLVDEGG